jgi:hypothetical protein
VPRPLGPDSDLVCSDLERIVWIKTQLLRESGRRPSGRPACSRRGPGELRAAIGHRRQVDGGRAPAGRACRSAAAAIRSGGRQTRRAAAAPRPQRVVGVGDRALVPPRPRVVMVETLQTKTRSGSNGCRSALRRSFGSRPRGLDHCGAVVAGRARCHNAAHAWPAPGTNVVQIPPWRVTVHAMAPCPWPGCNHSVQPLLPWHERWPHTKGYLRERPPLLPHVPTRSMDPGIRTIATTTVSRSCPHRTAGGRPG